MSINSVVGIDACRVAPSDIAEMFGVTEQGYCVVGDPVATADGTVVTLAAGSAWVEAANGDFVFVSWDDCEISVEGLTLPLVGLQVWVEDHSRNPFNGASVAAVSASEAPAAGWLPLAAVILSETDPTGVTSVGVEASTKAAAAAETITTLTDNGDGTATYVDEAGVATTISTESTTFEQLCQLWANDQPTPFQTDGPYVWDLTQGDFADLNQQELDTLESFTIPMVASDGPAVAANNGDPICLKLRLRPDQWLNASAAGQTSIVDNGDGTYTVTNPDGSTFTIDTNTSGSPTQTHEWLYDVLAMAEIVDGNIENVVAPSMVSERVEYGTGDLSWQPSATANGAVIPGSEKEIILGPNLVASALGLPTPIQVLGSYSIKGITRAGSAVSMALEYRILDVYNSDAELVPWTSLHGGSDVMGVGPDGRGLAQAEQYFPKSTVIEVPTTAVVGPMGSGAVKVQTRLVQLNYSAGTGPQTDTLSNNLSTLDFVVPALFDATNL